MIDEGAPRKAKPNIIARMAQWIAFILALLILLLGLTMRQYSWVPGISKEALFASIAVAAIVTVLTCPPLFWKMPSIGRWIVNLAILVSLIYVTDTLVSVQAWYNLTPEGASEAAERAKQEVEDAKQRAAEDKRRRIEERYKAAKQRLEESIEEAAEEKRKVASCIGGWSGQVSALSDEVKNSLHNPHAFEHVATELLDPNPDNNNVTMTFRAENGFGALRSWTVNARIDPGSCDVIHVGEPSQN